MSQGIERPKNPILPQFINLSDKDGNYLTINPANFGPSPLDLLFSPRNILRCNKQEPDANCTFEVVPLSDGRILLKGANGKFVARIDCPDALFSCMSSTGDTPFTILHAQGNQIYLRTATDSATLQSFLTSRQHTTKLGIAGSTYSGTECLFTVSEPIISKEIISIDYDLSNVLMWDVPPLIALSTTVRNDSKSSEVQKTLTYSYLRSKVGTWNHAAGVEIGTKTTFQAGVPFIASTEVEVSTSASRSNQWGGSEGTEETVSSSTQVIVPPGKKAKAIVLVKRKGMDVRFRFKEKIVYKDGTTKITDKDGVYHNIESYDVDVEVKDWEDA